MAGFSFIHAADLHLGSPMGALAKYEGCPEEKIRGAVEKALRNLVDLAIREEVGFVILAGDLFDRQPKSAQAGLFFNVEMRRLKEEGIRVFAIAGNHDAESSTWSNVPKPVIELLPTDKAGTIELEIGEHSVAIHGHSFPGNKVTKNLAKDYPGAVEGAFNIGILHTSLDNPESDHKTYAPCHLEDLLEKDYDYWALGHIHIPQVLNEHPHILYSGNLQGRSIREVGPRGCYLVKVNAQREIESCEMQELDVVRWFKREVDLSDVVEMDQVPEAIGEAFEDTLDAANGRVPVVRLELIGATSLSTQLQTQAEDLYIDWVDLANEKGVWLEKVKVLTTLPEDHATSKPVENFADLVQSLHKQERLDAEEFLKYPRIKKLLSSVPKSLKGQLKDELVMDLSATTEQAKVELESKLLHSGN